MLNVIRTVELPNLPFPTVEVFLRLIEGVVWFGIKTFSKDGKEFEFSMDATPWDDAEEFLVVADEFFEEASWEDGLETAVLAIQTRTAEEAMEYCTR